MTRHWPSPRARLGRVLRTRVAGPSREERAQAIWAAPGPRWNSPDDVISQVNGDASMYVGGIRSLLLQSLHPKAMAGVAGHSGYRSDPWGRLQRTAEFIAMTTYGPIPAAEELIGRVRSIHERVRGKDDRGEPYRASDPHLLRWVHVAETESFLVAHDVMGSRRLSSQERDEYVAQAAHVGELLGGVDLPRTVAELTDSIEAYRPELRASPAALDTARFLLRTPPLPWLARPGYWMLAAGAVATLPSWARGELRLPTGRWFDVAARACGRLATSVVRWGLAPESRHGGGLAPITEGGNDAGRLRR